MSCASDPLISVITVMRNEARTLPATLASVAAQSFRDFEFIVIDGGSRDGSVELLQRHSDQISRWLSEPDRGIADAMNKGIALARGEWLLFLGADDCFADPEALARAASQLSPDCDVLALPVQFGAGETAPLLRPRRWWAWLNIKGLPHQGTLIRRALFQRCGLYDTTYAVGMDYEFFLRALRRGAQFRVGGVSAIVSMGTAGISSRRDWSALSLRFAEERRAHFRHLPTRWLAPLYMFYWALYWSYRRVRAALGAH